jgi:hypothetical protein
LLDAAALAGAKTMVTMALHRVKMSPTDHFGILRYC